MMGYIVVSIVGGILFGVLDGVIHANPLAQRLYQVYQPIARTSIDPLAGIMIDLVYGFVMAGVFLLLSIYPLKRCSIHLSLDWARCLYWACFMGLP
jgi:hypothetical protein